MKCALIGGAGFIGLHLAERLLAGGHAVRVFDLKEGDTPRRREIEWVRGDFLDAANVRKAIAGCDAVFHLAWTTLPKSSNDDPAADVESNVLGTLRLLEAWRGSRGKFVFVSSGGTVRGSPRRPYFGPSFCTCSADWWMNWVASTCRTSRWSSPAPEHPRSISAFAQTSPARWRRSTTIFIAFCNAWPWKLSRPTAGQFPSRR